MAKRNLLYIAWLAMKYRCATHPRYIKRGITVCARWDIYQNFADDMGERPTPEHSLDRINNDLGYSPVNCRWATHLTQARNTSFKPQHITLIGENHWKLQITIRPGKRIRKGSKNKQLLNDLLSDLLFETEMHKRLGFYM